MGWDKHCIKHIVDEDERRGGCDEGEKEDDDAPCDRRNGFQRAPLRAVMTRRGKYPLILLPRSNIVGKPLFGMSA